MKIPNYNKKIKQPTYLKMQEEIERLKDDNKYLNKVNIELSREKNRLNNIIKEVREYINKIPTQPVIRVFKKELLELLDKANKEE